MDQALEQSEEMLEMLNLRGEVGFVHPQIAGATYQRSAEVVDALLASGRVEKIKARGAVAYRVSAAERERQAEAKAKAVADVLAAVTAQPDLRVDDLATAAPHVPEKLRHAALARLLGDGEIRETDGRLVTAELAAERDADAKAEDFIRSTTAPFSAEWLKSTGRHRTDSVGRAVAKLEAAGDLATLPDGTYEYSTPLDRRIRDLVVAASASSFLKKARGVSVADVAAELDLDQQTTEITLFALMQRGWLTREVRANAFYYLKA